MTALAGLDDIERLYAAKGGLHYGEGVTQLEHALQSAALADAQAASPSLIAAALLHDIGHLFEQEEQVVEDRFDDRHETVGARMLERLFPQSVYRPIALHVAAKRYLCFTEPQYWAGLSAASQKSLVLQGGAFDRTQAVAFERASYWQDAVLIRRFDDMGKRDTLSPRVFSDYMPLLRDLLINRN
jgi:phosphonate degradation associated HDIG domain protein